MSTGKRVEEDECTCGPENSRWKACREGHTVNRAEWLLLVQVAWVGAGEGSQRPPPHPQEGQNAIAQGRFPAGVTGHQEGFRADRPRPGCQEEPSGSVSRRTVGWGWARGT